MGDSPAAHSRVTLDQGSHEPGLGFVGASASSLASLAFGPFAVEENGRVLACAGSWENCHFRQALVDLQLSRGPQKAARKVGLGPRLSEGPLPLGPAAAQSAWPLALSFPSVSAG